MKNYTEEEAKALVGKLTLGQTMLVNIKMTEGGKFQLELAEKMKSANGGTTINVLQMLNADDDRFQLGGSRRAWAPADSAQLVQFFGFDAQVLADLTVGEKLFVCIPSPKLGDIDLRVRIIETVEGDEYDMENVDTQAKRAGKDGDILTHKGAAIFSKTYVVGCMPGENPEHIYLISDQEEEKAAAKAAGVTAPIAAPSLD